MKIFGIIGWSGSGKTELVVKLIPELKGRGFSISTIKHAHHGFDMDRPGKDTFRHREAGAKEVMVASAERWALQRELDSEAEFDMAELIRRMNPVDIVLVEGFKSHKNPKLEVYRPSLGKLLIATNDPTVVAVACDGDVAAPGAQILDLNDPLAIADFIVDYLKVSPA